ncbi:MAG: Lrp/AsnC family transcriptional regulator [Clostridiales bacterium]|nr:Lrp/AsnC family transcriptional regulator [Clostridiales bacterium]MDY4895048.1 Lrp/AsnC family transcriptional regulator [Christensenellaceae bacterium]
MKKSENHQPYVIDDTDRQILSLLKDNARIPAKRIAEKTFLSPTAIATRIERLEEEGYITGYHAHLNPELLGFQVKAFINLEVDPVRKKEFYPYIQSQLNVVECNCVTGDFSMLVEVLFPTTSDLDVFINELQHFGRTKTLIVFSTSVEHRDSFIDVRED